MFKSYLKYQKTLLATFTDIWNLMDVKNLCQNIYFRLRFDLLKTMNTYLRLKNPVVCEEFLSLDGISI